MFEKRLESLNFGEVGLEMVKTLAGSTSSHDAQALGMEVIGILESSK
jgi:hypothetical protein